jgi:hypothetical protein
LWRVGGNSRDPRIQAPEKGDDKVKPWREKEEGAVAKHRLIAAEANGEGPGRRVEPAVGQDWTFILGFSKKGERNTVGLSFNPVAQHVHQEVRGPTNFCHSEIKSSLNTGRFYP